MAALREINFQGTLIPKWQFCDISTAVRESVCLAGDRKAACLSGSRIILAGQWRRAGIVGARL